MALLVMRSGILMRVSKDHSVMCSPKQVSLWLMRILCSMIKFCKTHVKLRDPVVSTAAAVVINSLVIATIKSDTLIKGL